MTLPTGTGEHLSVQALSDEQLITMRNHYNSLLEPAYMVDSGKYDTIAAVVKEIETEINRREHEGPPWLCD